MDKKVEIYTSSSCPFCHQAKDFLTENNIAFTEYNITEDPSHQEKLLERSGQSHIPVIYINDEMIVGFDESKLRELLSL